MKLSIPSTIAITVIFVLIIVAFVVIHDHTQKIPANMTKTNHWTYFYSQECPHCKNVDKYLATHALPSKLSLTKSEATQNTKNLRALIEAAKTCHLSMERIPIPVLYNGSQCYVGDQGIINYLKQQERLNEKK